MKVDPRFLVEAGPEVFTGSELLIKGALEADGGTHYLGGYPGSPVAEFFDRMTTLKELLADKGIHAVINNNETLAAAGAILALQELGYANVVVIASSGENTVVMQRLGLSREETIASRAAEATEALAIAGIEDVRFLGVPDGQVTLSFVAELIDSLI